METYNVVPVEGTLQELAGRLVAAGHKEVLIGAECVSFVPMNDSDVFAEWDGWRDAIEAHFNCTFVSVS